jgi:hypothetical protein
MTPQELRAKAAQMAKEAEKADQPEVKQHLAEMARFYHRIADKDDELHPEWLIQRNRT